GVGAGERVEVDQRGAAPVVLAAFGLVAQVARSLGDGLPGRIAHIGASVHHLGSGGQGDPGPLRHLLQGDATTSRNALRHDLTSPPVPETVGTGVQYRTVPR